MIRSNPLSGAVVTSLRSTRFCPVSGGNSRRIRVVDDHFLLDLHELAPVKNSFRIHPKDKRSRDTSRKCFCYPHFRIFIARHASVCLARRILLNLSRRLFGGSRMICLHSDNVGTFRNGSRGKRSSCCSFQLPRRQFRKVNGR
jgi:hypothetical protein